MAAGWEAGPQRALDLVVAGGVDVQPELAEQREDAAARVGLHRVAQREPERRREGQRPAGRALQLRPIVDVARGPETLTHLGRLLGRQSWHDAEIGRRRRRMQCPRHPSVSAARAPAGEVAVAGRQGLLRFRWLRSCRATRRRGFDRPFAHRVDSRGTEGDPVAPPRPPRPPRARAGRDARVPRVVISNRSLYGLLEMEVIQRLRQPRSSVTRRPPAGTSNAHSSLVMGLPHAAQGSSRPRPPQRRPGIALGSAPSSMSCRTPRHRVVSRGAPDR